MIELIWIHVARLKTVREKKHFLILISFFAVKMEAKQQKKLGQYHLYFLPNFKFVKMPKNNFNLKFQCCSSGISLFHFKHFFVSFI